MATSSNRIGQRGKLVADVLDRSACLPGRSTGSGTPRHGARAAADPSAARRRRPPRAARANDSLEGRPVEGARDSFRRPAVRRAVADGGSGNRPPSARRPAPTAHDAARPDTRSGSARYAPRRLTASRRSKKHAIVSPRRAGGSSVRAASSERCATMFEAPPAALGQPRVTRRLPHAAQPRQQTGPAPECPVQRDVREAASPALSSASALLHTHAAAPSSGAPQPPWPLTLSAKIWSNCRSTRSRCASSTASSAG